MSKSYGAISFSGVTKVGPFYTSILNGGKRQTIRKPRVDGRPHVKPGYTFNLYWKMRTPVDRKPIHLIGVAECVEYETVYLHEMWDDESNALLDGFISLDEFRDWFYPDWKLWDQDKLLRRLTNFSQLFEYRRIKWAWPLVESYAPQADQMSEDILVLKLFQSQYTGLAAWEVDEDKSTVKLPRYDGSDNQQVILRVIAEDTEDG